MRFVKLLYLVITIVASGCAGTQFDRIDEAYLQLGKTTSVEIIEKLGQPFEDVSGFANGQPTRTLVYAYAYTGSSVIAKTKGALPVKGQAFIFHKDRLISYQYVANLQDNHTDFDEGKIKLIEQSKSTEIQVRQLMGTPTGHAIFPAIKQTNGHAMLYHYAETHSLTTSGKKARFVIDDAGVVVEVYFNNQGNWGK